jgi:hypothetical protein
MTLFEYLKQPLRPWRPGVVDCTTFAGDWALTWGFGDPMVEWRGRYSTDDEARRLVDDAGGLVNLWQCGLASIGVAEVATPQAGDIGVIWAVGLDHTPEQIGAIWNGRRWSFRIEPAIVHASADMLRCWGPRHG